VTKSKIVPLKITCTLLDGRLNSSDGLIFLDAILYHAWFKLHAPEVYEGTLEESRIKYIGLPLRQLKNNRWAASVGFYRQYDEKIEYWTKKPNIHGIDAHERLDLEGKRGKIDISAGEYRAYRMPQLIRTVGPIEFYCMGNPRKIAEMLNIMTCIGKKPAMGWGTVKGWTIEPVEQDYTTDGPYGLMRPMPIAEYPAGDYLVRDCAVKPPYWKTSNQEICVIPEVQINDYK